VSVALTFDDGPEAAATPLILDILAERGVPATFFVIGAHAEANRELIARELEEGHAVQPHCWNWESHNRQAELGTEALEADLARTLRTLAVLRCPKPTLWRPPMGHISDPDSFDAARACGLRVMTWTMETYDWHEGHGVGRILRDVREDGVLEPDSVILMHDLHKTARLLGPLLDLIAERGHEVRSLAPDNRALVSEGDSR
jgi:peptidoglycan/xylan/chitin deacetylase (PgdA/CDA1 family)